MAETSGKLKQRVDKGGRGRKRTHAVLPSDSTLADIFGLPRQLLKDRRRKKADFLKLHSEKSIFDQK